MIDLGIYQTKDGKEYDCNYIPADRIAEAIGPLPETGVGSRGVAHRVKANTEQDARKKLAEKIDPGQFV